MLRFRQQQGDVRHKFAPEVTVKTLKGYVASHINVRMMTSALEKGNALNISQIVLEFDPDDNTTVMVKCPFPSCTSFHPIHVKHATKQVSVAMDQESLLRRGKLRMVREIP